MSLGARVWDRFREVLRELASARRQLEDYKLQAQRLAAQRERAGAERVVKGIIPVLENFRKALEFAEGEEDPKALKEGLKMIWDDALAKIEALGIEEIAPKPGERFDPQLMEAVGVEEGGEPGRVAKLVSPGFKFEGKVVKPARVVVYGEN